MLPETKSNFVFSGKVERTRNAGALSFCRKLKSVRR
jgi:hypothetical protein